MESVSVPEAARCLGVSERRVRQLIELRRLPAQKIGKQWIVDSRDVDQLLRSKRRAGRPYSSRNAWGLLVLAAGREPEWLTTSERERLRSVLTSFGITELLPRLTHRSEVREWYVHPSLLERLSEDSRTAVGGAAAIESLIDELVVDVYLSASAATAIEGEYFVDATTDDPNVFAHVVAGPWPFEPGQKRVDPIVAAADLLDRASDARSVRVAKEMLADA